MSPAVNRKKQRRRQKQAARLAEPQQLPNGSHAPAEAADLDQQSQQSSRDHADADADDADTRSHQDAANEEAAAATNGNGVQQQQQQSEAPQQEAQTKSSKKKKKKKKKSGQNGSAQTSNSGGQSTTAAGDKGSGKKKATDRIWNTSTQEERENIKKFWLELGEEERRALVKVEKDAVLKKMKEQQKHSCSCTVCGRKRTAIEEELEVLYDAYYEELEQYANTSQGAFENGGPMVPPPRMYQSRLHSLDHRQPHTHRNHHSSHGRVHEVPEEEEEDLDDDYDEDEEDDEPYTEDDLEDEASRNARADFFAFGNSLTVKDGILTVADDLLKNDGKHFIDMMEQLAERRMQREEDTQYGLAAAHQSLHAGHGHGPLDDEDDYDDEDDDDYDSQEEDDYEDDEMDAMTEEQRMEEGRRMFQIFAARMFEQRVLTAYREKVAQQRQELLLKELMEEQTLNEQRNAKKAREAQKRKDKKLKQKQAREEERARREAEKAAEEAAARAAQQQKLEEQRKKREEERKKKEAEKKKQEEERLRKEAERQRRLQEERERQAEAERKQREQKERERQKREEARKKEKEEKERETREKKAKEEQERKAREEQERKAREEQAKRDARREKEKENNMQAESGGNKQASKQTQPAIPSSQPAPSGTKRTSAAPTIETIPVPPGLQHPAAQATNSPHFQVATPVVPKAPTPALPRQPSNQGSHSSSPRSQAAASTEPLASVSPRTQSLSQSSGTPSSSSAKLGVSQPAPHYPQPSAPLSPLGGTGRPPTTGHTYMNGYAAVPPPGLSPQPLPHEAVPGYPAQPGAMGSQFRGFSVPEGTIPPPPGIGPGRPVQASGRGFSVEAAPPGLPLGTQQTLPGPISTNIPAGRVAPSPQKPGSFERSPLDTSASAQPISRPSPIKPPSSPSRRDDVENLSRQLGSSALLDDTDVSFSSSLSQGLPAPSFGPSRASFGASPFDPLGTPKHPPPGFSHTWGVANAFGSPFPPSTWAAGSGGAWPNHAFGPGGPHRAHTSRPVAIRLLAIQALKQLNATSPSEGHSGFHEVHQVLKQVEQLAPPNEPPISLKELLVICDTEGNPQNGGGSFVVKEENGAQYVKFEPDDNTAFSSQRANSLVPGDIGSPVPGNSIPAPFSGIGSTPGPRQFISPTSF